MLKEAEAAAYINLSQENLAAYVKLLEEGLADLATELAEVREELEAALDPDDCIDQRDRITELEDELDTLRGVEG